MTWEVRKRPYIGEESRCFILKDIIYLCLCYLYFVCSNGRFRLWVLSTFKIYSFLCFWVCSFYRLYKEAANHAFHIRFYSYRFNPFLPIYLERNTWQLVDVLSGVLLIMWTVATFNRGFALKLSETFQIIKKDPKGFFKDFTGLLST